MVGVADPGHGRMALEDRPVYLSRRDGRAVEAWSIRDYGRARFSCRPRDRLVVNAVPRIRGDATVGIANIRSDRIAPRDEAAARVEACGTQVVAHVRDEGELAGCDAPVSKRHP